MFRFLVLLAVALVVSQAAVIFNDACPQEDVKCPLNCMFGYAVNKDGCEVCECQNTPCSESGDNCKFAKKVSADEKDCAETNTCNIIPKAGVCPDQVCQTFCEFGFVKGKSGCPICKCNANPCKSAQCGETSTCVAKEEKCQNPPCEWKGECTPACPAKECKDKCPFGFKSDNNGCNTCECVENHCDAAKCPVNQKCVFEPKKQEFHACVCENKACDLTCPFGLARDANGCQTCKCVTHPCESVTCAEGYFCLPSQEKVCLEKPCAFKANCFEKSKIVAN